MQKKTLVLLLLFITAIVVGASFYFHPDTPNTPAAAGVRESRIVMERAMQIVREKKPTPVQASIFYAKVARQYHDHIGEPVEYSTSTLITELETIVQNDDQVVQTRPDGDPFWTSPLQPFSPNAGSIPQFIIDDNFSYTVPAPPEYMGDEFLKNLAEVKMASGNRTPEQGAIINFWGGVPGTEAPAGIWQNRLEEVSRKYNLSDKQYAYAQMILAESIADAFIECWGVKFSYWTKRPDMVDATIQTAMPNPPFPGYVSGHSTISFAAATVLGQFFPDDASLYIHDATEAKNTRLWAGIHFSHDNDEGERLGIEIGKFVIEKLKLTPIL